MVETKGLGLQELGVLQMRFLVLDRTWLDLKTFMPRRIVAKVQENGASNLNPKVRQMVFQWTWRKSLGFAPSPGQFLESLESLL